MFRHIVTLLVFLLCSMPALAAENPQTAVTEVQRAIDSRDMALFEERTDVNALLQQGVTTFFSLMNNQSSAALPPVLALMVASASTPQLQDSLRGLLVKEAKSFLRYGIESGHFAGDPRPGSKPSGLMGPLLNDASLGRKELRVTGKARQENGTVRLPAELKDLGNGKTYPLDLRLKQVNSKWRIVELCNINTLTRTLGKEMDES